jgi:YidC/Oxa1 family membrane protein insertase
MDKKTILAVLLILVVFWISSEFIWKKQKPVTTEQPVTENVIETPVSSQPEVQSVTEIPIETQTDVDIRDDIILENDLLKITFTNLGGEITSIQLKEYFLSDKITPVDLIPENESIFSIELQMNTGNVINLRNVAFQHEIYEESNRLRLITKTENGMIEKTFTLSDNYQLDFTLKTNGYESLKGYNLGIESGIADTEEYLKMKSREYKIVGQLDNTITKLTLSKLLVIWIGLL